MLPTVFSAMTVRARMPVSSMSPSLVTWARTISPRTLRMTMPPLIVLMSTVEELEADVGLRGVVARELPLRGGLRREQAGERERREQQARSVAAAGVGV